MESARVALILVEFVGTMEELNLDVSARMDFIQQHAIHR